MAKGTLLCRNYNGQSQEVKSKIDAKWIWKKLLRHKYWQISSYCD